MKQLIGHLKTYYKEELTDGDPSILPSRVTGFAEDSRGNIWIKRQGGYSFYDQQQDTFYNFLTNINPDNSFDPVSQFAEDKQGRMWISSAGGSLGYAMIETPEKGIVQKFDLQALGGFISIYRMRDERTWYVRTYEKYIRI